MGGRQWPESQLFAGSTCGNPKILGDEVLPNKVF